MNLLRPQVVACDRFSAAAIKIFNASNLNYTNLFVMLQEKINLYSLVNT